MKLILTLCSFLTLFCAIGQNIEVNHQLKGLTIRSSVVKGNKGLLGTKGDEKGSGFVYGLNKKGKWKILNKGKALNPEVEDVQAVALVTADIYLAGTWKNGLFISENKGQSWEKLSKFPSQDIRCIQVSQHSQLIYAATTDKGILKSVDNGYNWTVCTADSLVKSTSAWSIEIDPENDSIVYAMSFGGGVLKSTDQGCSWESILSQDGIMFYDLAISTVNSSKLWAAGANDTSGVFYFSYDQGEHWSITKNIPNITMNEVIVIEELEFVVAGSWGQGCYLMRNDYTWTKMEAIAFDTITDFWIQNDSVLHVFTWGDGVYRIDLSEL
ncbi:MAG: photosystem II stability/assembly factor-like uncharacterized protein [Crocinitomix sp.]|jgi:photosystem II stability/assembly factor-like uncharacterized protein